MRLSLKVKVLCLAIVPVLLFALVISLTTVWILKGQARNEVDETRQHLLDAAKATLQSYVEVAMTTIKPLYDAAAPGDTAARAEVVKLLSNTSYGKDGYFFGYDSETIRLFKGNSPDGVGKSFKDNRDPNGVYVNRDLVKVGKDGTHYLQYSSTQPGQTELVPKLGYTEYLPKWDMVFGTSVNLDGIDAQVAVVEAKVKKRMEGVLLSIFGVAVLVLLVIAAAGMVLANTILRPLHLMKANLDDIAAGEGDLTRRLAITSQDELGDLAGAFNRFVEKIHGLVRQITEMTAQLTGLVGQVSDQAQRSEQAMERSASRDRPGGHRDQSNVFRRPGSGAQCPRRFRGCATDRRRGPGRQARGGRQHRADPCAGERYPQQRRVPRQLAAGRVVDCQRARRDPLDCRADQPVGP